MKDLCSYHCYHCNKIYPLIIVTIVIRVDNIESLLRDDDHALATHTRRRKGKHHFKKETHKGSHPPMKFQKNRKGDHKQK